MQTKPKNLGRAYLVGKLQAGGLSRRQAVLVVNIILERMIHALRRGWEVKFPLGKLKLVKRHFSKLWDAIDDWPANRDPYMIVHELDEAAAVTAASRARVDGSQGRCHTFECAPGRGGNANEKREGQAVSCAHYVNSTPTEAEPGTAAAEIRQSALRNQGAFASLPEGDRGWPSCTAFQVLRS